MDNIPAELKYTATHEWVRDEGDNLFSIGITDPAQALLGTVKSIDLPFEQDSLHAGDDCASVETIKTASDIFMPLSGEIAAVNDMLEDQPELINSDPYGDGWLIQIHIRDRNELDDLLDAESYQEMINEDEFDYDEDSDN